MDFISNLPHNEIAVVNALVSIGFRPEPIIRTSGRQKFVVLHNGKTYCAVYYDFENDEIMIGADNKIFTPDLQYSLTISGVLTKELLATVSRAASEYTIRKVGRFDDDQTDRMFESDTTEPGLFEKAGVPSNDNYKRAWSIMSNIGLDVIGPFIVAHESDPMSCYEDAMGDESSPMCRISKSSWNHIILVYKKVAAYLATEENVGKLTAKANEDNDVDNIPALASKPKMVKLDPVDDDESYPEMSEEEQLAAYNEDLANLYSYVKAASNVVIKHKKDRMFLTRCCLVTGTSGTSKTWTVEAALKENGMKKDVDYYITNLAANTANALYNMLYTHNGKIIVLDDCNNIFSGGNRIAFWKVAAETTPKPLGAPNIDTTKTSNIYYNPKSVRNRRDRFYREAGWAPKTDEEMSAEGKGRVTTHLKKVPKGIPDTFLFDGCVIVISNMTLQKLEKQTSQEGSPDDWYAVRDRFKLITLAPPPPILWKVVKQKIEDDCKDATLNDATRVLNSAFASDVISEIERIMAENPDDYVFQWRTVIKIAALLAPEEVAGPFPADIDKIWRKELRAMMLPKSRFR